MSTDFEQLVRRIVREELARARDDDPAPSGIDDDVEQELRRRASETATRMRRARSG